MPRPAKDMKGQRFGKLVILYRVPRIECENKRSAHWMCRCDCGSLKSIPGHNLRSGSTGTCNGCRVKKPRTHYSKFTQAQKDSCRKARMKHYETNRERINRKKNEHYHANRDKYLSIERARNYKKLYGITIQDYDRMFLQQGGKCGICGQEDATRSDKNKHFSVDHCHQTGKVRGLLCVACNHLLGRFEKHRDKIALYLSRSTGVECSELIKVK